MPIECPYCHGLVAAGPSEGGQVVTCQECGRQVAPPGAPARYDDRDAHVRRPQSLQPAGEAAMVVDAAREQHANYLGFYINLDRSVERRRDVEAQLQRFNLAHRYRRFAAVEGAAAAPRHSPLRPAEIGCFLSHVEVLRQNLGGQPHLHIIEDDVLFCRRTDEVLRSCLLSGVLDNFDILFTDVLLPLEIHRIRDFKTFFDDIVRQHGPVSTDTFQGFKVIDLKNAFFATTSSYVVNRASLAKLHELLTAALDRGPQIPLDLTIRAMAQDGEIRAGSVFPFITSVRLDQTINTTMEGRRAGDLGALANNIVRHMFYVDCDWQLCATLSHDIWQRRELDAHEKIISQLVHYKLFGDYKVF